MYYSFWRNEPMKKMKLSIVISLVLATMLCVLPLGAFAATAIDTSQDTTPETTAGGVIIQTVNLINANKNQRGTGLFWHNPSDTLTITNMTIDTPENYGLRLPDGATLVLEGNNVIKASKVALSVEGNLTIRGKGTLTLISGDNGIVVSTFDVNKKLTMIEGKVSIQSAGDGIYTENAIVSQNDKAKVEINTQGGAYAINARQIKLLGGEYKSNASLYGEDIKLMTVKLNIASDKAAFVIKNAGDAAYEKLSINDIALKTGADANSLSDADSYNGEYAVSAKVKKVNTKTSAFLELFGVKIPGSNWLDFVLVILVIVVVAAFIATPYVKNYRSKGDVAAKIAAAREEEKLNMQKQKEEKFGDK